MQAKLVGKAFPVEGRPRICLSVWGNHAVACDGGYARTVVGERLAGAAKREHLCCGVGDAVGALQLNAY